MTDSLTLTSWIATYENGVTAEHVTEAAARQFAPDVVQRTETYHVGDKVNVYAFGGLREGTVTKLGKSRVTVHFVRNRSGGTSERAFVASEIWLVDCYESDESAEPQHASVECDDLEPDTDERGVELAELASERASYDAEQAAESAAWSALSAPDDCPSCAEGGEPDQCDQDCPTRTRAGSTSPTAEVLGLLAEIGYPDPTPERLAELADSDPFGEGDVLRGATWGDAVRIELAPAALAEPLDTAELSRLPLDEWRQRMAALRAERARRLAAEPAADDLDGPAPVTFVETDPATWSVPGPVRGRPYVVDNVPAGYQWREVDDTGELHLWSPDGRDVSDAYYSAAAEPTAEPVVCVACGTLVAPAELHAGHAAMGGNGWTPGARCLGPNRHDPWAALDHPSFRPPFVTGERVIRLADDAHGTVYRVDWDALSAQWLAGVRLDDGSHGGGSPDAFVREPSAVVRAGATVPECPHGCGRLAWIDDAWRCPECGDEFAAECPQCNEAVEPEGAANHDGGGWVLGLDPARLAWSHAATLDGLCPVMDPHGAGYVPAWPVLRSRHASAEAIEAAMATGKQHAAAERAGRRCWQCGAPVAGSCCLDCGTVDLPRPASPVTYQASR
jgi:hypothetical protein